MTIGTNDTKPKFGTQDSIDDGSTSTIANDAYSVAGDITEWTNDEDAPFANFILKCQFDTTMPTVGVIDLYARPTNIEGVNEAEVPDDNHPFIYIDSFPIDFGVANDVDFYTTIVGAVLPNFKTSQTYEFYLKNNASAQTMGVSWALWINPYTWGPSA